MRTEFAGFPPSARLRHFSSMLRLSSIDSSQNSLNAPKMSRTSSWLTRQLVGFAVVDQGRRGA